MLLNQQMNHFSLDGICVLIFVYKYMFEFLLKERTNIIMFHK